MKDFIAEINANPMDEDVFMDLVKIGDQAMSGRLRVIPPDAERCLEAGGLYLADIPENQMGMAICKECIDRFGKEQGNRISQAYMMRWYALCEAFHDGVLQDYVQVEGKRVNTHPAVFRAAARAPLNRDGLFDTDQYVALVREIMDEE